METFRQDERGQHLVMLAVAFAVLLGLLAIVVDVGRAYQHHRHAQNAADAAALAGAMALCADGSADPVGDATNAVFEYANRNGFPNNPPASSVVPLVEPNALSVRATVQDEIGLTFGAVLSDIPLTAPATARAICTDAAPWPTVLILHHTMCRSLHTGTGDLFVPNGHIHVNSDGTTRNPGAGCVGGIDPEDREATYVEVPNGSIQTLTPSQFRGPCPQCVGNPAVSPPPITGPTVPILPDPLAAVPPPGPPYPADCQTICTRPTAWCTAQGLRMPLPDANGWLHYPPGVYPWAVVVNANQPVFFDDDTQPAPLTCGGINLYAFQDNITINGTLPVTGPNLTWYIQGPPARGMLSMGGGATPVLSATTQETADNVGSPYGNILIFQARNNTSTATVSGNGNTVLDGIIYVPAAELKLSGTPDDAYKATLIADRLSLDGGAAVIVEGVDRGNEGQWIQLVE